VPADAKSNKIKERQYDKTFTQDLKDKFKKAAFQHWRKATEHEEPLAPKTDKSLDMINYSPLKIQQKHSISLKDFLSKNETTKIEAHMINTAAVRTGQQSVVEGKSTAVTTATTIAATTKTTIIQTIDQTEFTGLVHEPLSGQSPTRNLPTLSAKSVSTSVPTPSTLLSTQSAPLPAKPTSAQPSAISSSSTQSTPTLTKSSQEQDQIASTVTATLSTKKLILSDEFKKVIIKEKKSTLFTNELKAAFIKAFFQQWKIVFQDSKIQDAKAAIQQKIIYQFQSRVERNGASLSTKGIHNS